jgi:FKBP-type peptidyl-prolyl cis-trans isomerase
MTKSLFVALLPMLMVACNNSDSIYAGFKQMESGAYMKFYTHGDSKVMPQFDDEVTFEMTQYFNDSMLFTTAGDKPMTMVLKKPDFIGDIPDALRMMHVGDSACLMVLSDSVFITMMKIEVPEQFARKPIYYDLKLVSVKPAEVVEAERKAHVDSLRIAEHDFLASLKEDSKNTVTESGIIVMEKQGKNKCAQLGDFVNFDFTMCGLSGDTIMNSFGVEPIEMQYGEEFFCEGFHKALGMVPVGGTMRFVIPSKLAFDSLGYEQYIEPYTPLVVFLKMNSVMDKLAYEKQQAVLAAEKEAEKERKLKLESEAIAAWIKDNNVTELPTESGLYILRLEKGTGNIAKSGDEVSIHYELINLDGDLLESSYDYGNPISFRLGEGEMIPAIEEAILTMASGEKVRLVVPSELGFGDISINEEWLPAYTPLIIDLELVSIQ